MQIFIHYGYFKLVLTIIVIIYNNINANMIQFLSEETLTKLPALYLAIISNMNHIYVIYAYY